MAWGRLDDSLWRNPKVWSVSPVAFRAYIMSISWSVDNLTDGYIPSRKVGLIWGTKRVHSVSLALVQARLLSSVDGGWQIHDFDEYNQSAEQVKQRRKQWRDAQARMRGLGHSSADDSDDDSVYPVPSRPKSVSKSVVSTVVGAPKNDDDDGLCQLCRADAENEADGHDDIRDRRRWVVARIKTLHAKGTCTVAQPDGTPRRHFEPMSAEYIAQLTGRTEEL